MSKNIEKIENKGKTIAIIIRHNFGQEGISFISNPKDPFQVGVLNHQPGYVVKSHLHNKISKENKENQEFLFIIFGKVEVDFYDKEKLIGKKILCSGDALLQMNGGHGFKILKPSKLIEVKQGPFYGNEKEKTYI